MTTAVLSFALPGRVTLRCAEAGIDDRRDLGADPPFATWSRLYAGGRRGADELLAIGLVIGRWLDGPQQWLARLVGATPPVILEIETGPRPGSIERAALDAPWELIAHRDRGPRRPAMPAAPGPTRDIATADRAELAALLVTEDLAQAQHLALDPSVLLTCVRRLGPAAVPRAPSAYRLSVVFTAAQPDGTAGLDVDREEVVIRGAAGGIGMDLAVEDCGCLARLGELVAQTGECDVIHVSCHGAGGDLPVLALEGELGNRVDATAHDLSLNIGTKPRLAFVSACYSADPGDALWSLSADLCRRGWPAVLGWSCAVTDRGAIELAGILYRQLALRLPLTEALARARALFADTPDGAEWHQARQFLGPAGGGRVVDGTDPQPDWPDPVRDQEYLDTRTWSIPVAGADQRFPHRRAFQQVMAALRDGDYNGVVVHGGDELARATFAARALRRLEPGRSRVVVARDFDAAAIVEAIRVQTASDVIGAIARQYGDRLRTEPGSLLEALRRIVVGPGQNLETGAFVLVVHGFDPAPTAGEPPGERRGLDAVRLPVARALIGAFAGARTASRLLFTSAAPFSVPTDDGDLADTLLAESLEPG